MDETPNQSEPLSSETSSTDNDWRTLRREERAARRAERRERRGSSSFGWMGGAVLIVIGVVYLIQNFTGNPVLFNWWALFIVIPAIGAFSSAWDQYQKHGNLTNGAIGSLIGGLVLTMIAATFLFGLSFGNIGPIIIILAGVALLITALVPRS